MITALYRDGRSVTFPCVTDELVRDVGNGMVFNIKEGETLVWPKPWVPPPNKRLAKPTPATTFPVYKPSRGRTQSNNATEVYKRDAGFAYGGLLEHHFTHGPREHLLHEESDYAFNPADL